jgi:hypothetical protein
MLKYKKNGMWILALFLNSNVIQKIYNRKSIAILNVDNYNRKVTVNSDLYNKSVIFFDINVFFLHFIARFIV